LLMVGNSIHGEISAINACTAVFIARNMTPTEIYAAWGELSLYTNAESCPMCASAIRWAGFKGSTSFPPHLLERS
jgi:tRNA(Arg) A34 adenosine deaminase TadA